MSILEPRPAFDADDPLLDAVVGLYAYAHRVRAAIEELAPPESEAAASLDPLPEPFVALLLGIVSTSDSLKRLVSDAAPPNAAAKVSPPAPQQGSFLR